MQFLLLTTIITGAAAWNLSAKLCQDFDLTVTVTSSNFVFGAPKFNNDFDITDFVTDLTSREFPKTFSPLLPDKINQTGTYRIGSTFCAPSNPHAPNRDTVIFATHGLNFDRTYVPPAPYTNLFCCSLLLDIGIQAFSQKSIVSLIMP